MKVHYRPVLNKDGKLGHVEVDKQHYESMDAKAQKNYLEKIKSELNDQGLKFNPERDYIKITDLNIAVRPKIGGL